MQKNLSEAWTLARATWKEYQKDGAALMGAATAFYALLSFAPLMVLTVAIVGVFIGEAAAREALLARAELAVGQSGSEAIRRFTEQLRFNAGTTIFSLPVLLYGATRLFTQLQLAMNRVWNVEPIPANSMLQTASRIAKKRLLSFVMLLGIGVLLFSSVLLNAGLNAAAGFLPSSVPAGWVWRAGDLAASLLIGTVLFAAIFKVLPDARIQWRHVWVGGFATSFLFALGKIVLGLYLGYRAVRLADGAAGSLVVLLLWAHYSTQVFFLGAEFTEVYAHRHGAGIVPNDYARRLVPDAEPFGTKEKIGQGG